MSRTKPTLPELAAACGISLATLKRYKSEGVDIYDSDAVHAHATDKKNPPKGKVSADLAEARRRLIDVQIERHQHFLAVARGEFTANSEIKRDMMRIGSAVRTSLERIEADAPTWEGLSATEIHGRVCAHLTRVRQELHDETSSLYQ